MNGGGSPNTVFAMAFGPYEFHLDRKGLVASIKAGAEDDWLVRSSPLGWIELEPGGRIPLGDCRLRSLSEKMGHQGKRILFGLEAPGGVPVDVYVICGPKEVQITVEASRDTRDARVVGFGLLPGWCATGRSGALVVPWAGGVVVPADGGPAPGVFDVAGCDEDSILFGAFVGSVPHGVGGGGAGLCLIHDSIHGRLHVTEEADGKSATWEFPVEPERRRLDLRIVVVPDVDPLGIARVFRENRIHERSHVTLRRKGRERPAALEALARGEAGVSVDGDRKATDRWDALDRLGSEVKALEAGVPGPIETTFAGEWTAPWVECWTGGWLRPSNAIPDGWDRVPLMEVVWRDAVVCGRRVDDRDTFLDALLHLAWPEPESNHEGARLLRAVHAATIGAFLVGCERLPERPESLRTVWSNRMQVTVNAGLEPCVWPDGLRLEPGGWRIEPDLEGVASEGIAL